MILLRDIRYVRLGTRDLDAAARFARDILGLEPAGCDTGARYFRSDNRDHTLVFLKGERALGGHRQVTRRPDGVQFMHYECELTIVVGRTAKKVKRDDAYKLIQRHALEGDDLHGRIAADPEITKHIPVEELASLFDIDHHLRHIDDLFARALEDADGAA